MPHPLLRPQLRQRLRFNLANPLPCDVELLTYLGLSYLARWELSLQ